MWNYGDPFPSFVRTPLKQPDWVPYEITGEIFTGFSSQTGTYFETPGHFPSAGHNYTIDEIPFERLIDIPVHVLHLPGPYPTDRRVPVSLSDVEAALDGRNIPCGEAVLIDGGWGKYWDSDFYLKGPYFSYDAILRLLEIKPWLLGSDLPRWENLERLENFFPAFYEQDILMLAPVINLEKIESTGLLTIMPLNIRNSCCTPCRAFIRH